MVAAIKCRSSLSHAFCTVSVLHSPSLLKNLVIFASFSTLTRVLLFLTEALQILERAFKTIILQIMNKLINESHCLFDALNSPSPQTFLTSDNWKLYSSVIQKEMIKVSHAIHAVICQQLTFRNLHCKCTRCLQ